jgi:ABC-type oligopeptide transport system substrate-binding subunit
LRNIASYTSRQQLVLRRLPDYHGDRPHRLDQIVFAIGSTPARARVNPFDAGGSTDDYLPPSAAGATNFRRGSPTRRFALIVTICAMMAGR